jgi:hypothetical protein
MDALVAGAWRALLAEAVLAARSERTADARTIRLPAEVRLPADFHHRLLAVIFSG